MTAARLIYEAAKEKKAVIAWKVKEHQSRVNEADKILAEVNVTEEEANIELAAAEVNQL